MPADGSAPAPISPQFEISGTRAWRSTDGYFSALDSQGNPLALRIYASDVDYIAPRGENASEIGFKAAGTPRFQFAMSANRLRQGIEANQWLYLDGRPTNAELASVGADIG